MQKIIGLVAMLSASLVLHTGCTTTGATSVSPQDFLQNEPELTSQLSELVAGDTIEVSVEVDGSMEVLSHRAQINHQGMVTLPLVGDVEVGGCTLSKARGIISKTYGAYYVSPPVIMIAFMIDPGDGERGAVTVMGRVARPGRVPLRSQNGMNLTEVIQEAGGFSASAKKTNILISRIDRDGKKIKVSINFEEIGQEGNADADIKLIDGDIVYVPERVF